MKKNIPVLAVMAIFVLVVAACNPQADEMQRPKISVSILPQKYFIEKLADTLVDVNVLIPPGASPETYDPTPRQMLDLSNSLAYIKVGHLGFELHWMESFMKENPDLKFYSMSKNIELIEIEENHDMDAHDHQHHGVEPHIWTSPKQMLSAIQELANNLRELLPEHSQQISSNEQALMTEIEALDKKFRQLSELNNRSFMIFHPALSYMARDYGLEQISIEFEGKSPSPRHLQKILQLATQKSIKQILIQEEFDSSNAQLVAKEIDAKVTVINPLSYNWQEEMLHLYQVLSEGDTKIDN